MKKYGKQQYTEEEAALAYANNYCAGDKFRLVKETVQALRHGRWVSLGSTKSLAQKWDDANPNIF